MLILIYKMKMQIQMREMEMVYKGIMYKEMLKILMKVMKLIQMMN